MGGCHGPKARQPAHTPAAHRRSTMAPHGEEQQAAAPSSAQDQIRRQGFHKGGPEVQRWRRQGPRYRPQQNSAHEGGETLGRSKTPPRRSDTPRGRRYGSPSTQSRMPADAVPPWRPARHTEECPGWAEVLAPDDRDELLADDLATQEAQIQADADQRRQTARAEHKARMDARREKAEATMERRCQHGRRCHYGTTCTSTPSP